jgi:hypothetical protein
MSDAHIWAVISMAFVAVMFAIGSWASRCENSKTLERQLDWARERVDAQMGRIAALENERRR